MTRTEFLDLLDRHGADIDQWPAGLRLRAEATLTASGDLRGLLAAEQAMLAALADLPAASASAGLRQAILRIPLDHPRSIGSKSLWHGLVMTWRRWTAGMATATAAAVLGFVLGYGQLVPLPTATAGQPAGDDLVSALELSANIDTTELETTP